MRSLLAIVLFLSATICQADRVLVKGDVISSHSPVHKADNISPTALYGSMSVCTVSPTLAGMEHEGDSPFTNGMSLFPNAGAGQIFPEARFDAELQADIEAADIQILQQPKHGALVLRDGPDLKYLPHKNYVGDDKTIFLVKVGVRQIKVNYFIKVVDEIDTKDYGSYEKIRHKYCPQSE